MRNVGRLDAVKSMAQRQQSLKKKLVFNHIFLRQFFLPVEPYAAKSTKWMSTTLMCTQHSRKEAKKKRATHLIIQFAVMICRIFYHTIPIRPTHCTKLHVVCWFDVNLSDDRRSISAWMKATSSSASRFNVFIVVSVVKNNFVFVNSLFFSPLLLSLLRSVRAAQHSTDPSSQQPTQHWREKRRKQNSYIEYKIIVCGWNISQSPTQSQVNRIVFVR